MTKTAPAPGSGELQRLTLTGERRATFLDALSQAYSVTHAAKLIGLSRQALYDARKADEAFAAAWAEAIETGLDLLEDELRRRAVDGWTEDTFDGEGNLVRRVQRISPQDLHLQLKAGRPDLYRDNARVEVTGANGGPVEVAAGYQPPTLADLVKLAGDLGVLDQLGYTQAADTIDGVVVEDAEIEAGELS